MNKALWLGLLVSTMAFAGWWIAIVYAWPASSRPYLGGSQDNTFFDVLFGYNGFGRLSGNETGSVGGFGGAGGQWGPTGLTRLFNSAFGGEASWLLPAALILLVGVLAWTLPRHRTDRANGCAVAALGGDAVRKSPALRRTVTAGVRQQIDRIVSLLKRGTPAARRRRALATYSGMVGALTLARAVDDPALAREILAAARDAFGKDSP